MTVLVFGALCGLALLLSESTVAHLEGNPLSLAFLWRALPAYGFLGGAAGLLLALLVVAQRHSSRRRTAALPVGSFPFVLTGLLVLAVQGTVLINVSIHSAPAASSSAGLITTAMWLLPWFATSWSATALVRNRSPLEARASTLLGVLLSSWCMARVQALFLRMPRDHSQAVQHAALVWLVAVVAFLLPFLSIRWVSFLAKAGRAGSVGAAVLGTLVGALVFSIAAPEVSIVAQKAPVPLPPSAAFQPNVILIVIDTLRADHLSAYGYPRTTSRNLDALSRSSVIFANCYSPANWTPPGHASIFTGKYPISHGAHKFLDDRGRGINGCYPLQEDETTLAEVLGENGYRTAAVVSNHGYVSAASGLDQGFQYWFAEPPTEPPWRFEPLLQTLLDKAARNATQSTPVRALPYRRASEINRIAENWLDEDGGEPFFLFLNYMDPHAPYLPPAPWNDRFEGRIKGFEFDIAALRSGEIGYSDAEWKHVVSQYDGEITYVDSMLGEWFEALRRRGLYDQTIIVVTSDHGEFLGEHGLGDHQIALYDPVIRVPLIIKPAQETLPPLRQPGPVQTIDILPTVLDMAGISIPASVQGRSLLEETPRTAVAQHYVAVQTREWFGGRFASDQLAWIEGGYKLVAAEGHRLELYDLRRDPGEMADLAHDHPDTAARFRGELETWETSVIVKSVNPDTLPEPDPETLRRLRALGYID